MHDIHISENHDDVVTRLYTQEIVNAFREQMQEVDRLADELHHLLLSYESNIEHAGVSDQIETLLGWAETYSAGLSTASKISRNGNDLLRGLGHRLHPEAYSKEKGAEKPQPTEEAHSTHGINVSAQPKKFMGAGRQLSRTPPPVHVPIEHNLSRFPMRSIQAR